MDWDKDTTAARPTFVLKADRRYMIESWGMGSWEAFFNGDHLYQADGEAVLTVLGSRAEAAKLCEDDYNGPERRIGRAVALADRIGSCELAKRMVAILTGREPDDSDDLDVP